MSRTAHRPGPGCEPGGQGGDEQRPEDAPVVGEAQVLACRGWKVFRLPLRSKEPEDGFMWKQRATCDPDEVGAMFAEPSNLAAETGAPSRVWVLDLDGPEAEEWLAARGPLPETVESTTCRERHLFFEMPAAGGDVRAAKGPADS